jgi:hypothetical protein
MSEILEIIMLICFGASWPINAKKAYNARSTKGTSLLFLLLILTGYIAGILSKFLNKSFMANIQNNWYVLVFYFLNLLSLTINLIIYFKNKRFENK